MTWLTLEAPAVSPYVPQHGDDVWFCRQGYREYLDTLTDHAVRTRLETIMSRDIARLAPIERAIVVGAPFFVFFCLRAPLKSVLVWFVEQKSIFQSDVEWIVGFPPRVAVTLNVPSLLYAASSSSSSAPASSSSTPSSHMIIEYSDHDEVPDFVLLRERYVPSSRPLTVGQHVTARFGEELYGGTLVAVSPYSTARETAAAILKTTGSRGSGGKGRATSSGTGNDNGNDDDSPWKSHVIKWDEGGQLDRMSPWELLVDGREYGRQENDPKEADEHNSMAHQPPL